MHKVCYRGVISVVMPSRKRPDGLRRAWNSLRLNAKYGRQLELLVAFDADDIDTYHNVTSLGGVALEFGERLYWDGNNQYFSQLCRSTVGEWIVLFGDDGEMLTVDWTESVLASKPGVLHLKGGIVGHNVFPIVHRSVFEALPWDVCPSPHQDTWLTDVARAAGILYDVDVEITEHRTIDETRPVDRFRYRTDEYYSAHMAELRSNDVKALMSVFSQG